MQPKCHRHTESLNFLFFLSNPIGRHIALFYFIKSTLKILWNHFSFLCFVISWLYHYSDIPIKEEISSVLSSLNLSPCLLHHIETLKKILLNEYIKKKILQRR